MRVAQISINRTTNKLNRPLAYLVPDAMANAAVGSRVYVPIKGSGREEGIILSLQTREEAGLLEDEKGLFIYDETTLKKIYLRPIVKVLDASPWFTAEMLSTADQISRYFLCPLGEALQLFTINKKTDKGYDRPKTLAYHRTDKELLFPTDFYKESWQYAYVEIPYDFGSKKKQKEAAEYIKLRGKVLEEELIDAGFSKAVCKALREVSCINSEPACLELKPKGERIRSLVEFVSSHDGVTYENLRKMDVKREDIKEALALNLITEEEVYKDTNTAFSTVQYDVEIPLTAEQKVVTDHIGDGISKGHYEKILLHGVTGSGKTQVYIKAVQDTLQQGKSAIVLVPEISLTYQIVKRFVERFGDEVVVFHSQLTPNERYNNWERLRRGESHIIIGARSAVFAPMDSIGLIVLDEEHDHSYKDWDNSHYHTRTVAEFRAKYFNCPLVLGSATPAVTTYYEATHGEGTLLSLPNRIHNTPLPDVKIVDMKEELFYGNYSVFSQLMHRLIAETLEKKEQMILLMNRRGYSTFILCRACGESIQCPHCDTSLIYHRENEAIRCHYCEYTEKIPKTCPKCGSTKIKFFGSGTQKVEETLRTEFPQARIARLDQDVKAKKGAADAVLEGFAKGEYDILLGTQMVSKGHDFENVTAAGIITADSTLNVPNYTAAEQTFSLLTQTAGRAGRGHTQGNVIIQTYNPTHYAIIDSKDHNYMAFYNEEIEARKAHNYPPFAQMIQILVSGKDKAKVLANANRIAQDLMKEFDDPALEIIGPYEESMYKLRDAYRMSIMVKGKDTKAVREYIYNSWIFTTDGFSVIVDPI